MNFIPSGIHHTNLLPLFIPHHHLQSTNFHRRRHFSNSISLDFFNAAPYPIAVCSATISSQTADIEMSRDCDGSWSANEQKVVVLWDLDNKPPRGKPYDAAIALRRVAELFGRVVEISAFANRHAFQHLPQWVLNSRRHRRNLDNLERKGFVVPSEPYICGVCGRKCRTNPDLSRHFRQLHERERQKKLSRMNSLKGRKREKYKARYINGNHKYIEAARKFITPKNGCGLDSELRRAGVFVKMVEDKPQAADSAVHRRMHDSMSRGIDYLFLVSDDSDFCNMIRKAREEDLRTVVIGDGRRSLGRLADFWIPWMQVEEGEVGEDELLSGRNSGFQGMKEDDDGEDDDVEVSVFSEGEMWDEEDVRWATGNDISGIIGSTLAGSSLSWTIEDDDDYYI